MDEFKKLLNESLRLSPESIIIAESTNSEEIEACIKATQSGHTVKVNILQE